ncbi:hypothetical protein IBX73_00440 [candidate division WOR-3 bacterium]|nr:hypothetical protein [candidate division WOR-3 bacterium]
MKIVQANSLAATLDRLNEVFFTGRPLPANERKRVASWIASRQGAEGSYRGMFAPTPLDYRRGITLFTGERVVSGAAIGHILGEEASRALILLNGSSEIAQEALKKSNKGIIKALMNCEMPGRPRGFYCCGTCTAAMWRHLAAGGLNKSRKRLSHGLKGLRKYRDGVGKWRRFPFYYTLLALSEIEDKQALDEMRYAAMVCERYLKRGRVKSKVITRRRALIERVLAKC